MGADALSHIPKREYDQCREADSVRALISQAVLSTTLMEAYSCNVQVTETLDMQKDPKAMSVKDWVNIHQEDPTINNKRLKWRKVYSQDAQIIKQYLRQHGHLVLCWGSYTDGQPPSKKDQNALQLVIPQDYRKKALQGLS